MIKSTLVFMMCLLVGCISSQSYESTSLGSKEFFKRNQDAAESLNMQIHKQISLKESPMIISTLVDMGKLSKTSSFGRLVSEQLSSEFTKKGFKVLEPKLRNSMLVKEEGEFLISRELKDIAKSVSAQFVLVGTYTESFSDVYINLKIVEPETNLVIAASSYAIPKAKDIKLMLFN